MKNKEKTWKILAIVFMSLFAVETIFFIYVFKIGTDVMDNENECSINICSDSQYDAYQYDEFTKICYCYTDNEVAYQEYLK